MDFIVKIAEGFTGIVSAGGENLMSLITSILPNVLILLTFINALISLIGEERVMNFSRRLTRFRLLRYTLLPVMALFTTLGKSTTPLAVRYLLVGIIVIFIRGNVTEFITKQLMKRSKNQNERS